MSKEKSQGEVSAQEEKKVSNNDYEEPYVPDEIVIPPIDKVLNEKKELTNKEKKLLKKKKKKEKQISTVYVAGIGSDIKVDEIASYFSKCGVIMKEIDTAQPIIKILTDAQGNPQGDCLVTYFRPEAVDLAIQILDDSEIKPGRTIKVQKATLEQHESTKPGKVPKSKKIKLYDQSKELGWEEEDNCHVIIKNMFTQDEAWQEPSFFEELEKDVIEECERKCGPVSKVKIFERNPEGVLAIRFEDHYSAERCIKLMNGRWFAKKQLEAFFYDGFTNYHVEETEEQKQKRIDEFGKWLEEES